MAELTEYELQRLQHIKRNQEFMARLGIVHSAAAIQAPAACEAKPSRKRVKREPAEPSRRSGRLANQPAERDGAEIDALSDSEEGGKETRVAASREERERAMLDHTREWLAASRAALLASGVAPATPDGWRSQAVQRWGERVVASLPPGADWQTFVSSRLTSPPPPSSLDLLQEYYAHDAWQLLCCCVLMSRVSSWAVKHNTISAFFELCPHPSALLDAAPETLKVLLHPLGLFPGRMQSLVALSERFLEAPVFDVGLEAERKVYGIGAFGVASFQIFARGNIGVNPEDCTLKTFVTWQRRRAANQAKGHNHPSEEEE